VKLKKIITGTFLIVLVQAVLPVASLASDSGHGESSSVNVLLFIAIVLLFAKVGGGFEKLGIPAVLGELFAGIFLSLLGFLGLSIVSDIRSSELMHFFAELGAIILLFQVGLESNIAQMKSVGFRALMIALIGVFLPFVVGTFVMGPLLFPEDSSSAHLFIGASIVATSVGITASVFKAEHVLSSRPAQTVIGAAVIDDVLGLILLAIITALVTTGSISTVSILFLVLKAVTFLVVAIIAGSILAEPISRIFSYIHTGTGMKFGIVFVIALLYSYLASLFGLEPIIGAFAAGLVLDGVYFRFYEGPEISEHLSLLQGRNDEEKGHIEKLKLNVKEKHVESMMESVSLLFVPMFFAMTGLQIQIESLLNPQVYVLAIVITIIAIVTKIIAGFASEGGFNEHMLIGASMVPRGEVGLIFLSIGKSFNVISSELFSVLLIVIILTTFIAPFIIRKYVKLVCL